MANERTVNRVVVEIRTLNPLTEAQARQTVDDVLNNSSRRFATPTTFKVVQVSQARGAYGYVKQKPVRRRAKPTY